MWRKVNSHSAGQWQRRDWNQDGSVLGSTLEASHSTGPSEYKHQGRFWTHRHHREMYGCIILPSKPPAQRGRRFTVLSRGIQLELAGSQQAEQVNQLCIFWNGFFLSQINTVSPSNNLMRGREGNGKVEYAVCTKVMPKMVEKADSTPEPTTLSPWFLVVVVVGWWKTSLKIASVFATHWREPKHLLLKIIFKTSRWHRPQREKWGRDFTCLISG